MLLGHSYGGALAQSAARKHKESVEGLILTATIPVETGKTQLESWGGSVSGFLPLSFQNGLW